MNLLKNAIQLSRSIGSFVPLNSALGASAEIRCSSRISPRLKLPPLVSYPICKELTEKASANRPMGAKYVHESIYGRPWASESGRKLLCLYSSLELPL